MDRSEIFPQDLRDRAGEERIQRKMDEERKIPDFGFEDDWGRSREIDSLVRIDYLSRWAADIVDIFEKFLKEKGIERPNKEKKYADNKAILYGGDYSQVEDDVIEILKDLIDEKTTEFKREHEIEEDEVMEE
jgi:hypothetical protein